MTAFRTLAAPALAALLLGAAVPAFAQGLGGPGFDFATLDADGDGKITRAELDAARQGRIAGLDADGDGRISRDELIAHHTREAQARATRMAEAMMDSLDADGDGFLAAAELAARPVPVRMFDRLDTDGDGAISQAEADAARDRMAQRGGHGGHGGHGGKGGGHGGWFGGAPRN